MTNAQRRAYEKKHNITREEANSILAGLENNTQIVSDSGAKKFDDNMDKKNLIDGCMPDIGFELRRQKVHGIKSYQFTHDNLECCEVETNKFVVFGQSNRLELAYAAVFESQSEALDYMNNVKLYSMPTIVFEDIGDQVRTSAFGEKFVDVKAHVVHEESVNPTIYHA